MQLILASQSPRRKELLGLFHIPFTVRVADIDETMDPSLPPYDEVARVSRQQAEAIARDGDDVVVAADTIVVCQGRVLGKPRSPEDAKAMGVKDKQTVRLQVFTERPVIFEDVAVRVSPDFATYVHLDYDEANACGFLKGDLGRILP